PELAGPGRRGLRQGRLPDRLGGADGHLPNGQAEPLLAGEPGRYQTRDGRRAFLAPGLFTLSRPLSVHPTPGRTTRTGPATACRARSIMDCTTTPTDRGLQSSVRGPR